MFKLLKNIGLKEWLLTLVVFVLIFGQVYMTNGKDYKLMSPEKAK